MLCATGQAPGCDFSEEQNTCPFSALSEEFCGKCTYCRSRFVKTENVGMLRTMANVLCRPYAISETATLTLVDKMEVTLYPGITITKDDDPLWEVALLRQGIPKELNDQLVEKISSAEYLIEHSGPISAVLGGSSFPATVLCNDFRKADGPTDHFLISWFLSKPIRENWFMW